jgi:hypothetical protein
MVGTGDVDAPVMLGCSRRAISASVRVRKADAASRWASRPPAPTSGKSFRLDLIRPRSLQVSLNERAVEITLGRRPGLLVPLQKEANVTWYPAREIEYPGAESEPAQPQTPLRPGIDFRCLSAKCLRPVELAYLL